MRGMGWKWGATVGDWVIRGSRAGQVRGLGRLLACQTLCRFTPAAGQKALRFKFCGRWHEVGRGRASSLFTTLLKVGVSSSSGTTSPASPSSPSGNISGPSVASYRSQFCGVSQERRACALIISLWKSRTSPSASVMADVVKGEKCRVDVEEFLWECLRLSDVVCDGGFCGKGAKLLAYCPPLFEGQAVKVVDETKDGVADGWYGGAMFDGGGYLPLGCTSRCECSSW